MFYKMGNANHFCVFFIDENLVNVDIENEEDEENNNADDDANDDEDNDEDDSAEDSEEYNLTGIRSFSVKKLFF